MSFLTDLRAVSESVMEQLADRFSDLPRPLLAAIGAGDMAVERFAELRESMVDSIPNRGSLDAPDVRALATDLPARAQKAAAEVAGSLEQFAAQAPARAQELIAELPGRVSEIAQSLSAETVRETVEAYSNLAGVIYGNLAKRGGQTWSQRRSPGLVPGTVVEPSVPRAATAAAPDAAAAASRRAARTSAPTPAATGEPIGVKLAAAKAAAAKPAAGKPAARTATAKTTPTKTAAAKSAATKPAAPARVAPKTAGRRPPIPKDAPDPFPAG